MGESSIGSIPKTQRQKYFSTKKQYLSRRKEREDAEKYIRESGNEAAS